MYFKEHFTTVTPVSKIVALIMLVALPFAGFYFGMRYTIRNDAPIQIIVRDVNRISSGTAPNTQNTISEELTCRDNSKYMAVSKSRSGSPLSSILVKYKDTEGENISCNYLVQSGDYEIVDLEATYLMALTDNFLVLDTGTGPDVRKLTIIDLTLRQEVYTDSYSKETSTENDLLTYWEPTNDPVTPTNCPQMDEWLAGGLGARIDKQVRLNMSTLTKEDLGKRECFPEQ